MATPPRSSPRLRRAPRVKYCSSSDSSDEEEDVPQPIFSDDSEEEEEEEEKPRPAAARRKKSGAVDAKLPKAAAAAARRGGGKADNWKPILPIEERSKKSSAKKSTNAFSVMMKAASSCAQVEDDEREELVISDPGEIFADIGRRFPELSEIAEKLGRPLRVATMCSGTEAPLLALDLLSRGLDKPLVVEHVFSSEVEPFKQAYIERNFSPPLLFRDVRELGDETAHTAFGALEAVPREKGSVDLLVAGTSCVDYSNLNREKKTIEEKGESGQTFYGMYSWVQRARPPVVLLENVCGAPWEGMVKNFEAIGYDAKATRLDTKRFYIPQTRTRGYLLAVAREASELDVTERWVKQLKKMERPASASLEAFMLDAHDPRVLSARHDLKHCARNKNDVPWDKCEARHARVRADEELGSKRPVTNWAHGTSQAALPDFAWRDWAGAQTERVLDSIDIDYIRLVTTGQDAHFKTSVWDLSQNVDRSDPTNAKLGICPCLTPSLCAFVTNQGRPVVGVETLALQGIPIDDLLLTRESEDNLTSLSGNAMSTAVVGSAIAAALLALDDKALRDIGKNGVGDDARRKKADNQIEAVVVDEQPGSLAESPLDLDGNRQAFVLHTKPHVSPDKENDSSLLVDEPASKNQRSTIALCERAVYASQKCACEAACETTDAKIFRCRACGHTACSKCAGRPEHDYVLDSSRRDPHPSRFEVALANLVPARLDFTCHVAAPTNAPAGWVDRLNGLGVGGSGPKTTRFRLVEASRCERQWKLIYLVEDASKANRQYSMVLTLSAAGAEWTISATPPSLKGETRDRLQTPVLRAAAQDDDLLPTDWEIKLPVDKEHSVTVKGKGEMIDAFESTLGIQRDDFKDKKRHSVYVIECETLPEISGSYDALPKCAAPLRTLHKKRDDNVYLFLESHPVGDVAEDNFVIARDWAKLGLGGGRHSTICCFKNEWNLFEAASTANVETTTATEVGAWTRCGSSTTYLRPAPTEALSGTVWRVAETLKFDATQAKTAKVCLKALVPEQPDLAFPGDNDSKWRSLALRGGVGAHGVVARETRDRLGYLVPRLKQVPEPLGRWTSLASLDELAKRALRGEPCCETCAPRPPSLQWVKVATSKTQVRFEAVEDPYLAGVYERALKDRPATFELEGRRRDGHHEFRVAVNATSLAARAFGSLPTRLQKLAAGDARASLEFRIVAVDDEASQHSSAAAASSSHGCFRLLSNKRDAEASQPAGFVAADAALRPEQRRSLTWMRARENVDSHSLSSCFVEEEVVDETLGLMGWRAEARACVPITVRGGVLADAVGYGKTAITLALIDAEWRDEPPEYPSKNAVSCKATLVIVPKHLMAQWPAELEKFLGPKRFKKVLSIATVADLNALTVREVLEADVIFCAVQAFRSQLYFDKLADFAAVHQFPSKGGRYFEEVHSRAVENVEKYCEIMLSGGGLAGVDKARREDREKLKVDVAVNTSKKQAYAGSIPKRGQREVKTKKVVAVPKEEVNDEDEDEWESSSESDEYDEPAPKRRKKSSVKKAGKKPSTWKDLRAPPLELFYFARKVVDEYTYLEARDVPTIQAIKSRCSWVLSGTPPMDSFDDVKAIAAYLGVNLGAPDPVQLTRKGTVAKSSTKAEQLSKSEVFHEFLEARSPAWHDRRRVVAQQFLDTFVRQNIAEIDEIPFEESVVDISLPTAERAVYLELEHHLTALEMQKNMHAGRGRRTKTTSDRELRLKRALSGSADAEEALLKRCAAFDQGAGKTASATCEAIVSQRRVELEQCATQIRAFVATAHKLDDELRRWAAKAPTLGLDPSKNVDRPLFEANKDGSMWFSSAVDKKQVSGHTHLRQWTSEIEKGVGDPEADAELRKLAKAGWELSQQQSRQQNKKGTSAATKKGDSSSWKLVGDLILDLSKARKLDELELPVAIATGESKDARRERFNTHKEMMWALREQVYELRALNKEYVGRTRSLRFFEAIHRFTTDKEACGEPAGKRRRVEKSSYRCDSGFDGSDPSKAALFSCCGHSGELGAWREAAKREACPIPGCLAAVRSHSVVPFSDLVSRNEDALADKTGGAKLAELVRLIRSFPADERVLVFVQFADLLSKVETALNDQNIKTLKIKGSAHQMMNAMTAFQRPVIAADDARVLLLELHNESASGANLTVANRIVFVHPLHVDSLQKYVACETQAIGRARRYGQKKDVNLYRLLVKDSMDRALFDMRTDQIKERNKKAAA